MNTYTHLNNIIEDLKANGVTPKVTKLRSTVNTRRKIAADRVGGAKTAWRPSVKAGHANRHLKAGTPATN